MPDDERLVAQMTIAFRKMLAEDRAGDRMVDGRETAGEEIGRGERRQQAILAVTGAALGDPMSLPPRDDCPEC
jgi:hypothetical protein